MALSSLPAVFHSFDVRRDGDHRVISWRSSFRDVVAFEVQRSTDGTFFTTLYRQEVSTLPPEKHPFTYTDREPINHGCYYRLRTVEADGRYTFSSVRYLPFLASDWQVNVRVSSTHEKPIRLEISGLDAFEQPAVYLHAPTGQTIWTGPARNAVVELPDLPAGGVYYCSVVRKDGSRIVRGIQVPR